MDKEVINMENIGVTCDVCACCHNVDGCKCDLLFYGSVGTGTI